MMTLLLAARLPAVAQDSSPAFARRDSAKVLVPQAPARREALVGERSPIPCRRSYFRVIVTEPTGSVVPPGAKCRSRFCIVGFFGLLSWSAAL